MKIDFYKHSLTEADIRLANEVMRSLFLTTGPMVERFEDKFAQYLSIPHAVGLTSCTGALHLALLRYGIGQGDEVITTPMTFAATVTSILQAGALPVFVDVCPNSGLLLAEDVQKAITPKTKALMPVHLYGRMVDMRKFKEAADKYNLILIEDAAHCIEGIRDGIRPGELSDAACFSFYATKSMTCGEGGALVCKSSVDRDWYVSARHHGISKNASSRYFKKYQHWDMDMMGWKYNMDDISAALLINQIDRLNENRKIRYNLEMKYRELLKDIDGLEFIEQPSQGETSANHMFTVLVPRDILRDEVIERLQESGIGCAVNYRAVHTLSYFRKTFGYRPEDFPTANEIGERTITLPLYPSLSMDDVDVICDIFKGVIKFLRSKL